MNINLKAVPASASDVKGMENTKQDPVESSFVETEDPELSYSVDVPSDLQSPYRLLVVRRKPFFPLLQLPRELRDQIYRYVVVSDHPLRPVMGSGISKGQTCKTGKSISRDTNRENDCSLADLVLCVALIFNYGLNICAALLKFCTTWHINRNHLRFSILQYWVLRASYTSPSLRIPSSGARKPFAALLFVNKQIYVEATEILIKENYIRVCAPEYRPLGVLLRMPDSITVRQLQLLETAPNLVVDVNWKSSSSHLARVLSKRRDIKSLYLLLALGMVELDRYISSELAFFITTKILMPLTSLRRLKELYVDVDARWRTKLQSNGFYMPLLVYVDLLGDTTRALTRPEQDDKLYEVPGMFLEDEG